MRQFLSALCMGGSHVREDGRARSSKHSLTGNTVQSQYVSDSSQLKYLIGSHMHWHWHCSLGTIGVSTQPETKPSRTSSAGAAARFPGTSWHLLHWQYAVCLKGSAVINKPGEANSIQARPWRCIARMAGAE